MNHKFVLFLKADLDEMKDVEGYLTYSLIHNLSGLFCLLNGRLITP